MSDPQYAINQLTAIAPALLKSAFRPDCCIAATRIVIDVCERLGFKARPQPTKLRVWNAPFWRRIVESGEHFKDCLLEGEWCVGVGFGLDPRHKTMPNVILRRPSGCNRRRRVACRSFFRSGITP